MNGLERLLSLQKQIQAAGGGWGAGARAAADVATFGGSPDGAAVLALGWRDAAAALELALETLHGVDQADMAGVWVGDAHNEAADAVRAMADEVARAVVAVREVSALLTAYADGLGSATGRDLAGQALLHEAPTQGVDLRVSAHAAVQEQAGELTAGLHDAAARARAHRLRILTPVDDVVLTSVDVLTPAMADRVAADRDMQMLLAGAKSTEHRAYLVKAFAAGHSAADVAVFDAAIAPYAHDPGWLDRHLSPLDPDAGPVGGRWAPTPWEQGPLPTCVASSLVTARAELDPIYALSVTLEDFPGRLRAEQLRVYDGGRSWVQDALGFDGMTPEQGREAADEEIGAATGRGYRTVDDAAGVLADIARAVDDGYPVPFVTADHQLLVIGHSGDQLQVYNPWGYTYWVSEKDFLDSSPTSVQLPRA
ncbi:hypothetical protein [Actinoplanes sp. NPDC051494]|uniref:hypothetical protein n=1 Tax=Actinoplanes sp. NPDC051494 TaxID=3363907 RepID=UPI0037A3AC90